MIQTILKPIRDYIFSAKRKACNIIKINHEYFIYDKLDRNSIIVDCGTGNNADFSVAVIDRFKCKSFGFDPTKKHLDFVRKLEKKLDGHYKHFDYAITAEGKKITFNESETNISGSIKNDHFNIKNDKILSYKVNSVKIADIFDIIGEKYISLLKMDIEGAEYAVLNAIEDNLFPQIDQFIIEFHHYCIDSETKQDTLNLVNKFREFGYKIYTEDDKVYLFYKK